MFPYRVKYTESKDDIQNNNLLYKLDQKYQNAFEIVEKSKMLANNQNNSKKTHSYFVIYINCIILIL